MTVGRGKDFERKETQSILKVMKNTEFYTHKRGRYQEKSWGDAEQVKLAFGDYLFWYIAQMTYPYGAPIISCWSHLYKAPSGGMGMHQDKEVPGGFKYKKHSGSGMGMHQDKHAFKGASWKDGDLYFNGNWTPGNFLDPLKLWSTTLLVTKSDDMEGGEIVLAGDGYEDLHKLTSRLKIVDLKEKGQTASWNGETMHGIAEITKGTRWVFVTFKEEK